MYNTESVSHDRCVTPKTTLGDGSGVEHPLPATNARLLALLGGPSYNALNIF